MSMAVLACTIAHDASYQHYHSQYNDTWGPRADRAIPTILAIVYVHHKTETFSNLGLKLSISSSAIVV